MFFAAVTLPLFSAFFVLLFGRFFNRIATAAISICTLAVSFSLICMLFIDYVAYGLRTNLQSANLLNIHGAYLFYSVAYDYLALVLLLVVFLISLLVNVYSVEYMWNDPHFNRFFGYLALFTFFMALLVASNNMVQFFIGWEGVGLISFLLVGFWFTRTQANVSALKAFIVNRVGDAAILSVLAATTAFFKIPGFSLFSFAEIRESYFFILINSSLDLHNDFGTFKYGLSFEVFFVLAIIIGAMSKSAQIFLHTWLPDAMEGPTPVSALIHAATMVAAGVYLLIRISFSIPVYGIFFDDLSSELALIGALTSVFAASVGIFQNDIKKIIAYSTCSQLGYMVAAALAGLTTFSAFHLVNHAFFKALLFLSSGALIHAMNDVQDIRRYGALLSVLPYTYCMFAIGSISLVAFPFTSGFYSKDIIIEFFSANCYTPGFTAVHSLLLLGSFLTAVYSIKLLYVTFVSNAHVTLVSILQARENHLLFAITLAALAFFSICSGAWFKEFFSPSSGYLWGTSINAVPVAVILQSEFMLGYYSKQIAFLLTLTGAWFGLLVYSGTLYSVLPYQIKKFLPTVGINNVAFKVFHFFSRKWYFDNIYNFFIVENLLLFSHEILAKEIESGILEFLVVGLATDFIDRFSLIIAKFATSNLRFYANCFIIGIFFYFCFAFYSSPNFGIKINTSYFIIPLFIHFCLIIVNALYEELYSDYSKRALGPLFVKNKITIVNKKILHFILLFYAGRMQQMFVTFIVTYFLATVIYFAKYRVIYPPWIYA